MVYIPDTVGLLKCRQVSDLHTDNSVGWHRLCIMISIGFLESTIYNVEVKFSKRTANLYIYTVQVLCAIYLPLIPLVSVYFHSHVRAVSCLVLSTSIYRLVI